MSRLGVVSIALGIMLSVLGGCSLFQPVAMKMDVSATEVVRRVHARVGTFHTMHASGTLAVESPTMSNSATFQLNVRRPDSAKITIRGPFGIRVGEALFTGSRFTFYNAINNEVTRGDVLEDGMPGLMDLHIKPADIYNTLSGTRTFASTETVPDSFMVRENKYVLVFLHGTGRTEYIVDPESFAIVSVRQISSAGVTNLEEEYVFSKEGDGTYDPESIRILREESAVLLSYERVKRNTELDPFTLEIPDDARWRSNR
jgi:outer membrane lipoprotein-sorting protein